jgi:hypothetical protein
MVKTYSLDDQAVASLLLCFQKAIMEETDIRELFAELQFAITSDQDAKLMVLNPPVISVVAEEKETEISKEEAERIAEDIVL